MTDMTTESVTRDTDLDSLGPVDYIVVEFLIFTPPFLALLLWRRRAGKAVDSSQ